MHASRQAAHLLLLLQTPDLPLLNHPPTQRSSRRSRRCGALRTCWRCGRGPPSTRCLGSSDEGTPMMMTATMSMTMGTMRRRTTRTMRSSTSRRAKVCVCVCVSVCVWRAASLVRPALVISLTEGKGGRGLSRVRPHPATHRAQLRCWRACGQHTTWLVGDSAAEKHRCVGRRRRRRRRLGEGHWLGTQAPSSHAACQQEARCGATRGASPARQQRHEVSSAPSAPLPLPSHPRPSTPPQQRLKTLAAALEKARVPVGADLPQVLAAGGYELFESRVFRPEGPSPSAVVRALLQDVAAAGPDGTG
jgi:hypothetical protein